MTKKQSIKKIRKADRPREKLQKYGTNKLSNAELLAILLRSGKKNENAISLAKKILNKFKTDNITKAKLKELQEIKGIGLAKACEIIACFELGRRFLNKKQTQLIMSPREIWGEMREIRNKKKEYCVIFYLNIRKQIISKEIISIGCLNSSIVHPREIFESAIKNNAAEIIICHNHPSGNTKPSREDIDITKRLIEAGNIIGIDVLDHIIVAENNWTSICKEGYI